MKFLKKRVLILDLTGMLKSLENCPCGKKHTFYTKDIEIGSGITAKTGEILRRNGFEDDLLLVADENTIAAAAGVRTAGEHVCHVRRDHGADGGKDDTRPR